MIPTVHFYECINKNIVYLKTSLTVRDEECSDIDMRQKQTTHIPFLCTILRDNQLPNRNSSPLRS